MVNDIYLNAIIAFSGEILSEIFCGFILYSIGRKSLVLNTCLLSAIFLILYYVTGLFSNVVQIIILFLCSVNITSSFSGIIIYLPEVYPTNMRSLSMNFNIRISRASGSLVYLVLMLTKEINIISIVLMIISVIVMFTLPETSDYNPGDEIEEMNEIKKWN